MFEHILIFLSFVYAIAIAYPLASITGLILARDRVVWSGLLLCWMANAVVLLMLNWLAILRLAALPSWTSLQLIVHFAAAFVLYFTCSLTCMRVEDAGTRVDMNAYFDRNRVPILAAFLLFSIIVVAVILVDLSASALTAEVATKRLIGLIPNFTVTLVALVVRRRWVQWAAALIVLGRLLYLAIQSAV